MTDMDEASISSDQTIDKRPQFGGRQLENPDEVFKHNAWDNVEWDEEQQAAADKVVAENSKNFVDKDAADKYESDASIYWDDFYDQHQTGFFKDRHWLFTEFPELASTTTLGECSSFKIDKSGSKIESDRSEIYPGSHADRRIFEIGCGVGNTVFPLLEQVSDPSMFIYCCDFSSKAIDLVKGHPQYDTNRCHAFVCDITEDPLNLPFPHESLDIVTLIFVLSAIDPSKMKKSISNVVKYLKPGGLLLLRDYGRYDMAQLRFKKGRCISENFYVRGDGTRVYFFTADELDGMLAEAGLVKESNHVDRRLQVNRGKMLKMYRIWIQCKYRKPVA